MAIEFVCESIDEMVYQVEDIHFRASECEILSEDESKVAPMLVIVLKSPQGYFAEVTITSYDNTSEKALIKRGRYEGRLYDEETARAFAGYVEVFSQKSD